MSTHGISPLSSHPDTYSSPAPTPAPAVTPAIAAAPPAPPTTIRMHPLSPPTDPDLAPTASAPHRMDVDDIVPSSQPSSQGEIPSSQPELDQAIRDLTSTPRPAHASPVPPNLTFEAITSEPRPTTILPPSDTPMASPAASVHSPLDPEWAHRPDPEPTEEDIARATRANAMNIPIGRSLAQYMSSGVLPEDQEVEASLFPPMPRTPSPPLTQSWVPTQQETIVGRKLDFLKASFPDLPEAYMTSALAQFQNDEAAVAAWLTSNKLDEYDLRFLLDAFPDAGPDVLSSRLQRHRGSVSNAYSSLQDEFTSSVTIPSSNPAARGVLALQAAAADTENWVINFSARAEELVAFEKKWWSSFATSRLPRLGVDSRFAHLWDPITKAAMCSDPINNRTMALICHLGGKRADPSGYLSALTALRLLPSYRAVENAVATSGAELIAPHILSIMLEDGFLSPGGAAWLATQLEDKPHRYQPLRSLFAGYRLKHGFVRQRLNASLLAYKARLESDDTADAAVSGSGAEHAPASAAPTSTAHNVIDLTGLPTGPQASITAYMTPRKTVPRRAGGTRAPAPRESRSPPSEARASSRSTAVRRAMAEAHVTTAAAISAKPPKAKKKETLLRGGVGKQKSEKKRDKGKTKDTDSVPIDELPAPRFAAPPDPPM